MTGRLNASASRTQTCNPHIFFAGTIVGMLLAGAAPVDAVRLQLVLLYTLLGSVFIAAFVAVVLTRRNFFTPAHQLREATTTAG